MKSVLIDFDSIKKYAPDINAQNLNVVKIEVTEDTQFVVDLTALAVLPEISIDFVFNKSKINAHVIGVYSLNDNQKLNTKLRAVHNVPETSCLIDIKGALFDKSYSYHFGEIYIGKQAFNTESYLSDHTLMLSEDVRTVSLPNLQIYNNNVKASHGASIGSVDSQKMYYLQSRGIEKNDAINILVSGFFESIFNDITDQNMANVLREKLLTLQ